MGADEGMTPFFQELLKRHETWRQFPLVERTGDGWRGFALAVPAPATSDLAHALEIEEVETEITISLDYSHVHVGWPPPAAGDTTSNVWADPFAIIDGIISEKIVSLSGWIDGQLRVGSLRRIGDGTDLIVPRLQHRRTRSWKGALDKDETLL